MSHDPDSPLPSSLQNHLCDEDGTDQTDLVSVWHLLGRIQGLPEASPDVESAWKTLQRRRPEIEEGTAEDRLQNGQAEAPSSSTSESSQKETRPSRSSRPSARSGRTRHGVRWAGAVAVVLIAVVAGAVLWRQPVTVTAAPGQQQTAQLPDGSTVELNSGTTLSHRRKFEALPFVDAGTRSVHLEGEAYFDVARGSRPFVVKTFNAVVQVEGTQFNVRARQEGVSTTDVTLAEGRVRIMARERPEEPVLLEERGQLSRVKAAGAPPTAPQFTGLQPVLAWRHDGFAASAEPLAEVLADLERRFDTSLRLHDSVERTRAPVSLYYPTPTGLDVILRDLCTALDLKYRPAPEGYELFAEPPGNENAPR